MSTEPELINPFFLISTELAKVPGTSMCNVNAGPNDHSCRHHMFLRLVIFHLHIHSSHVITISIKCYHCLYLVNQNKKRISLTKLFSNVKRNFQDRKQLALCTDKEFIHILAKH